MSAIPVDRSHYHAAVVPALLRRALAARPVRWRVRLSLGLIAVAVLATGATLLLRAELHPHSPVVHAAIAASATGLALCVSVLFFVWSVSSGQLRDLLIALGFGVLAAEQLAFGILPPIVAQHLTQADEWGAALLLTAGLGLLLAAAICRPADLRRRRVIARSVLAGTIACALVVSLMAWLVGPATTHTWTLLVRPAELPHHDVHPAATLMEVLTVLLAAWGAQRFARRSGRGGDNVDRALAIGLAVIAGTRLGYVLAPGAFSAGTMPETVGHMFAFVLVLCACVGRTQRRMVQRAVAEERRRIARNLHDGLAQELAYIASHSRRLEDGDDATVSHLRFAAERALLDSRTAIAVLRTPEGMPLQDAISRSLEPLGRRHGVAIDVHERGHVAVDRDTAQELLRIASEAATNAIRHGGARRISVDLASAGEGARLQVRDDGTGFDVEAVRARERGLGLVSMRERAEMLGGRLEIDSTPGQGALVEVTLP